MRRLSLFLLSLGGLVATAGVVFAQGMAPSDVTTMLAKSNTLDTRCNILAETDRQDLMDYLARAEILLAESESVKSAQTAMAKGRAAGESAPCGPEQNRFVAGILAAARTSTNTEPPQPLPHTGSAPAMAPKQAIVTDIKIKPSKKKSASVNVAVTAPQAKRASPAISPKKKNPPSFNAYAGLAQRYYVELKCRSMNGSAVRKLYGNVLASHRQAIAENGPSAVRAVLRGAETRAKASSC